MFYNSITGQGTGMDQVSGRCIAFKPRLASFEIESLLRDALVRRIVEARPGDISRVWREHTGDGASDWQKADKAYGTREAVYQADFMGEAYGGAIVLPCFDDSVPAEDYGQPFELSQYEGRENLRGWMVYNPHQLRANRASRVVSDIRSHQAGLPEHIEIGTFRVHSSWAVIRRGPIRLDSGMMSSMDMSRHFGESRLDMICEYVARALSSMQTIDTLMQKPLVDVWKMKTLLQDCADDEMASVLQKIMQRIELTMKSASASRSVVIDKDNEDFERSELSTGLTGAVAAMEFFTDMLAAAGDIPKTRLLGSQSKGLNNGGESDLQNYYDSVDSYRQRYTAPTLRRMDEITRVVDGLDDPNWSFGTLWQESDKDRCERFEKASKGYKVMLDADMPFARSWVARSARDEGFYAITDEELAEIEEQDGIDREGGG